MGNDYSWVTDEMFDEKLKEIIADDLSIFKSSAETLLTISGIYEILSEHYNNDVLADLKSDREESMLD